MFHKPKKSLPVLLTSTIVEMLVFKLNSGSLMCTDKKSFLSFFLPNPHFCVKGNLDEI